jgi:hydrogenase maturation protease
MPAKTLVFAWGNPSRGDDALGPEFLVRMETWRAACGCDAAVEWLTDFQLQPEHATDLDGRDIVLFVDASATCAEPYLFSRVAVRRDSSFTSHAMTPGALLAAYEQLRKRPAPPGYALGIRGHQFELGEAIGAAAQRNLDEALAFARTLLETPSPEHWDRMARNPGPESKGL